MTLLDMAKPNVYLQFKLELLEDGVVYSTPVNNVVEFTNEFGSDPLTYASTALLLNWSIYENGHTGTTRITLTHLADILPMKWTWDYNEVDDTFPDPGPDIPRSESLEITGSTVTKIFSPSGSTMHSNYINISNVVFTSPK